MARTSGRNNVQKEAWLTVYHWLKECGSSPDKDFCRREITIHPDYPSLLSIIDFLDSGAMAYQAVTADASYIHEFDYPLLAHIRQPGQEFIHMVVNTDAWNKEKEITQFWSGIVIYPAKNAAWRNNENDVYKWENKRNRVFTVLLSLAGIILCSVAGFNQTSMSISAFGLLSLAGLVISLYLLGEELGFQSQVVKQVCGAVSDGGCEKVLRSRYAEGLWGITPAAAATLYFSAQFVIYLAGRWYPVLLPFTFWLSLTGIAVVAWSIYTQGVKLRQWCALCLGVAGVLLVQATLAFAIIRSPGTYLPQLRPTFSSSFLFCGLFLLFAFILLPIKRLLKTNSTNELALAEIKKWKLDVDLFLDQWQKEPAADTTIWENDLLLGNPSAPLLLTIACSPYCPPCARTHARLDDLLDRFDGKLKVAMRFLCHPEHPDSMITQAVSGILRKASNVVNGAELKEILEDWFAWMDYEKWIEKWHSRPDIDVKERISQHFSWIVEADITHTPTLFLNGRRLPGKYGLEDMALLIPQLTETLLQPTLATG